MEALWKEPKRIDGFPHPLYHGFEPGVTTLKAGHVRDPKRGTRALPADLIWHRDVAVKNRAGLTLYIDVFLPAEQKGPLPALVSWSPYGKSGNGKAFPHVGG